jgi:hypothetical protein
VTVCPHPDFDAEVDVNRLEDIGAFTADVRIRCIACGEPFAFVGIPAGLSSDGPRVSVSGLEVHLPLRPVSAGLGNPTPYGFSVTAVGGGGTNATAGESGPHRHVVERRRGIA